MRDEDAPQLQIAARADLVGDVLHQTFFKAAAVLFADAHFAVLDLDARAELQKIRAEQRHGRAAAAHFHVVQPVKNEAGLHAAGQLLQSRDDLVRRHAGAGHSLGFEHDEAVAGGEISRVDNVDVVKIRRRELCVLIAAGEIEGNTDVNDKVILRGKLREHADIVRQVDRSRLRQTAARGDMRIDVVRADVHAVAQRFAVHVDVERQQADVVPLQQLGAEITGRVRRDLISHREPSFFSPASVRDARLWEPMISSVPLAQRAEKVAQRLRAGFFQDPAQHLRLKAARQMQHIDQTPGRTGFGVLCAVNDARQMRV